MTPEDVMTLWNDAAKRFALPLVRMLTKPRKQAVEARLREWPPETFQEVFAHLERSKFLRGHCNGERHLAWRCSFDFAVSQRGFTRILEGQYDDVRQDAPASILDPHYAIKRKIEHYLKTGKWIYGGLPPDQHWPAHLPRAILEGYRDQFAAKGMSLRT